MSDGITYNVVKSIGKIGESENGWTLELNLVSFNDLPPKYDIRSWSPDRSKMSKGARFTKEEILKLGEIISEL